MGAVTYSILLGQTVISRNLQERLFITQAFAIAFVAVGGEGKKLIYVGGQVETECIREIPLVFPCFVIEKVTKIKNKQYMCFNSMKRSYLAVVWQSFLWLNIEAATCGLTIIVTICLHINRSTIHNI